MSTFVSRLVASLLSVAACAAQPTIRAIDFFAYADVDIDGLRNNLTIRPGDPWTSETDQLLRSELEELLGRSPSEVTAVCCDEDGNRIVYIGLAGSSGSRIRLNPQPTGFLELDADLVILYDRFDEAVRQAVSRGDGLVSEDRSLGYPLSHDAEVRGLQQRIREYALSNSSLLFAVSRKSSNALHRGIAIDAIGYGLHSADQIAALTHSALDPDPTVRNNAIRALSVLASSQVELQAPIPYAVFVDLLAYGLRQDRSKSVALLSDLTEGRDPSLLEAIFQRALAPLVECARWSWSGHAYDARIILGRIGGLDEGIVLAEAWNSAFVDVALDSIQRSRAQ
ncbi:MAG: HEAT repeat domain-containing protein [Acidobacteriia bacterium]|nr:HEAT repeat domain-containing protein [Terriglobia bacterium]MYG01116.1 HEAT repeat domain-containing protein [Terriglobia bacterium]MYK11654.1 HEAT repeat domain-containing protein [Terriglobia bacterium]